MGVPTAAGSRGGSSATTRNSRHEELATSTRASAMIIVLGVVIAAVLVAAPIWGWELECNANDVCAVRTLDVTNNIMILGANDTGSKLTLVLGAPDWERFVPADGSKLSFRVSADEDPVSLEEHGTFVGGEKMFLFVFDDREIARSFISTLRSGARQVQFSFDVWHITRRSGTNDLSPKFDPSSATFFLEGFAAAWDQYCDVSPLEWLCVD